MPRGRGPDPPPAVYDARVDAYLDRIGYRGPRRAELRDGRRPLVA